MKCKHAETTTSGWRCYTASVAVHPYTEPNPAAGGWVTFTETCAKCGAQRPVNSNGPHLELGPWGPGRAAREAEQARIDDEHRARPPHVVEVGPAPAALIAGGGVDARWVQISDIRAAAQQPDTGDGLVPTYSRLLREIETWRRDYATTPALPKVFG
jgi:hypothetical protein